MLQAFVMRLVVQARTMIATCALRVARAWRTPTPPPSQTDQETQEMLRWWRKALIDGEIEPPQFVYRAVRDLRTKIVQETRQPVTDEQQQR